MLHLIWVLRGSIYVDSAIFGSHKFYHLLLFLIIYTLCVFYTLIQLNLHGSYIGDIYI